MNCLPESGNSGKAAYIYGHHHGVIGILVLININCLCLGAFVAILSRLSGFGFGPDYHAAGTLTRKKRL